MVFEDITTIVSHFPSSSPSPLDSEIKKRKQKDSEKMTTEKRKHLRMKFFDRKVIKKLLKILIEIDRENKLLLIGPNLSLHRQFWSVAVKVFLTQN